MTPANRWLSRVTLRLARDDHRLVTRAAQACGLSAPDYVIAVCLAAARRALRERGVILLDAEDYERLRAATERPARADPRLAELFASRARYGIAVEENLGPALRRRPGEREL